jgi:hypothetical protein
MTTDYSSLISLLGGGKSLRESAGLDADDILSSLRKKGAVSSDFMSALKSDLLAKALVAQQIGSMR